MPSDCTSNACHPQLHNSPLAHTDETSYTKKALNTAVMVSIDPVPPQYTILRLPASSPYTAKFRDTKLAALKKDPGEWIYPYSSEAKHPLSVWEARLAPPAITFVCVVTPDTNPSTEDALTQGDWVGFVAVRGPMAYDAYYASPDMQQPIPQDPDAEARWHMYDFYVFPAHRGQGIARKLVAACVAAVGENSVTMGDGSMKRAKIRIFVNAKKTGLVDTYNRWGFRQSGTANIREGLTANGMGESVPQDTTSTEELRAFFETRVGSAMEKVVDL
jgi:ribosomal protein S18 acetylase RimI-like enzyme